MKREDSENRSRPASTDPETAQAAWDADRRLVDRARQRDPEAVDTLARRMLCIPRILDAMARRTGPFRDADERLDTIQDVSARVWSALDRFQARASLESWIFGFCSLTLVDVRRGRMRRGRREVPLAEPTEIAEESAPEELASLDAATLHAAIARLTDEEAAVLEGRLFEGMTFEEFARRADVSPNTAKTRYYRALQRLRGWLRRSFDEPSDGAGPAPDERGAHS